jgi:hypothetical protein
MPVFHYDGRLSSNERGAVDEIQCTTRGAEGHEAKVLTSRTNVLIRCGQWWKASWEHQEEGRIYRYGQEKPKFVYEFYDENCEVDDYLRTPRDKNHRTHSQTLVAITARRWLTEMERRIGYFS